MVHTLIVYEHQPGGKKRDFRTNTESKKKKRFITTQATYRDDGAASSRPQTRNNEREVQNYVF